MRTSSAVPPLRVLQVGPARGTVGGMASVIDTYARLPLEAELSFLVSFRPEARLWSAGPWLRALGGMLRARSGVVVHVHLSQRGSFVREGSLVWVARVLGHPTVASLHGSDFVGFYRRHRALVRGVLRGVDVVLVLGQRSRELVSEEFPGVPCALVANPAERPGVTAPAGGRPPRAFFAGEVGRRKGVDVLLRAWGQVRARVPDAQLVVAGPAGDMTVVEGAGVSWLGVLAREDVRAQLERSRLAVLPSRSEVQPMFLLEAMALARPVVATLVGEVAELVGDAGILVPPEDVDALAEALTALLGDPARADALGGAGARRVQETHGPEAAAARLDAVYRRAAGRPDRAAVL